METFLDSSEIYLNFNLSLGNFTNYDGSYVVTDDGDTPPPELPADKIVVPVLFLVLSVAGLSTNSVALTLMYKRRKKFRLTDMYLLSHFISNILYLSLFVPIIAITYGITDWILGDSGCKSVNYGMTLCLAASVLSVTAACLHNSLASGRGQNEKTRTRSHRIAKVILLAIWLVAGIAMVPRVFLYRVVKMWHFTDERRFCTRNQGSAVFRQVDTCITCLALYSVPLLVQAACHIRVFRDLKKLSSNGIVCPRKTLSYILIAISAAVLVGWLPTHVINFSEDFAADSGGDGLLFRYRDVVAYGFSYATMSVTPLIYYFCQRRLRTCGSYTVSRNDESLLHLKSACLVFDIESGEAVISDSVKRTVQTSTSL